MKEVVIVRPDGKECPARYGEPSSGAARPGIVLATEMWGMTAPMLETAERCVAAGYRVLVPDLFRGRRATSLEQGLQAMRELDWNDAALQDLRGAARWLGQTSQKVAMLGFCLGGALSLIAAMHATELDAAVCFYGLPPESAGELETIPIPLLCHFAARDNWCLPEKVDAAELRMRAGGVDLELHRYDAAHAFMNPEGQGFSEAASRLAWQRTLGFLAEKLAAVT
jgi:carboxymethylenebutenolidase